MLPKRNCNFLSTPKAEPATYHPICSLGAGMNSSEPWDLWPLKLLWLTPLLQCIVVPRYPPGIGSRTPNRYQNRECLSPLGKMAEYSPPCVISDSTNYGGKFVDAEPRIPRVDCISHPTFGCSGVGEWLVIYFRINQ